MANVKLVNISKIYDKKTKAVKNIGFEVNDKEFMVLVGPSGCGKSTTLRMVAGLEEISEGELYIDGQLVNDVPPKNREIAMVFQNYALYPHMTVYENMAFGLKIRKYGKKEIKDRVTEAARVLGLEDLLKRKPRALSGGQSQRVALGRAIVRQPKVFLFDEPLSNLDAKLRVQMRTEISKLHRVLAATIIYVTHDQTEAMTMGDRIVIMRDGNIEQIDTPLKLYNFPANKFVGGFIGSPSMNFIEGNIDDNQGLNFISLKGDLKLPIESMRNKLNHYIGKPVTLGLRAKDIHEFQSWGKSDLSHFHPKIDVVEPVGNEIFIHFDIDDRRIVGRIPADVKVRADEKLELAFDIENLHFFDQETEQVI